MPGCLSPLLVWDILHRLGTKIILGGTLISSPLQMLLLEEPRSLPNSETWETQVSPLVWDQGIPGKAKTALPVIINLKNLSRFPNWKQFPLRPKAKWGLQSIISKFLQHGLLIPINSPCNTPILPIKKDETYHLIQDLQIIHKAVIPIHPIVPNPYILLGNILPETNWFTILDLKDSFFSIPLSAQS